MGSDGGVRHCALEEPRAARPFRGQRSQELVRLRASEPFRREGEHQVLGHGASARAREFGGHSFGINMQALEDLGQLRQNVIGEDDGMRQNDPLVRRIGEVPLVPLDHVLEWRQRERPHESGETRDVLRDDRIRFWAIVELPT